jgi:hypothetical protein
VFVRPAQKEKLTDDHHDSFIAGCGRTGPGGSGDMSMTTIEMMQVIRSLPGCHDAKIGLADNNKWYMEALNVEKSEKGCLISISGFANTPDGAVYSAYMEMCQCKSLVILENGKRRVFLPVKSGIGFYEQFDEVK